VITQARPNNAACSPSAPSARTELAGRYIPAPGYDQAESLISSAARGEFAQALAALALPHLHLTGPQGQRDRDRDLLVHIMDGDLSAGVQQQLVRVTPATS
jgi:hypothetical protein